MQMAPKFKPPFNPDGDEYRTRPAFVSQLQKLRQVCENDYGATESGQRACEIQCGVRIGYQVTVGQSDTQVRRVAYNNDNTRTQSPPPGRVINFHLVVSYRERVDGISAVHIQIDEKLRSILSPLEEALKSLLFRLQKSLAGSSSSPTSETIAPTVKQEFWPLTSSSSYRTAESFVDSSRPAPVRSPAYARMAGKQPACDLGLLDQMRSACEIAGAVLDPQTSNGNISDDCEYTSISGCYAGTPFRVSIHGIEDNVDNPDELFAEWEQPPNARQRSLPGIKFLVDVLDATVASKKYLQIIQQIRATSYLFSNGASSV
jgi:hypothetical protein